MDACRVLPLESGNGPANMGLDEALLESVAEGRSGAVLRTYSWSEPTLSLGYFQPMDLAEHEHRWQGVPMVRRPTGGGALWHDREVTYALVVPASHPLARRSPDLYRVVHTAIAGVLVRFGLDARRRGVRREASDKPFLCFADGDPEDVVALGTLLGDGEAEAEPGLNLGSAGASPSQALPPGVRVHKLVGSAQRRRSGAVLQHGSILLARSATTPELPGLGDLTRAEVDPQALAQAIAEAIPRALGLAAVPDELSAVERGLAGRLGAEIYRNSAWTRKR